mgnify:FL=1
MEITVFIVVFIASFLFFLSSVGVDVIQMLIRILARALLSTVIIYIANIVITYYGGKFIVNINEITVGVSGILGIWGVIFLYALEYYFTIT